MAVYSAIRDPDSLRFSSQSSLEAGIFSSWLPNGRSTARHCIYHQESKKEVTDLRQKLPPLWLPLIICTGWLSLMSTPNISLSWGRSSLKRAWERHFMLVARVDAMNKSRVSMWSGGEQMGRRRRTSHVWHNDLRGLDQQALLIETGWGFSPCKSSFSLLFSAILTQPFEEVGPLSFPGAQKHFPSPFFQPQKRAAGGGGEAAPAEDRPEQGS